MGVKNGIGWAGMALASVIAFAMAVIAYMLNPVNILRMQMGLCLDSPDLWQISPILSWILNICVIALIPLILYIINKRYNFIRTTEPTFPAVFLVMATSCPWFTQGLNTSTLLCLVNVACLGIIFSTYDQKNAISQMFIIGLVLGLGSMMQYAFLIMVAVYFLCALFMKVLRFKEMLAFLTGIVCPYWMALGLGLIHLSDFHMPSMISFFSTNNDHPDILFLLLGIGLAVFSGFIITLMNFMKLYAGNSKVSAMNLCVMTLGLALVILIFVDYENITAYVISLYLVTAVQISNICALWDISQQWLVSVVPSILYIALFAGTLIL